MLYLGDIPAEVGSDDDFYVFIDYYAFLQSNRPNKYFFEDYYDSKVLDAKLPFSYIDRYSGFVALIAKELVKAGLRDIVSECLAARVSSHYFLSIRILSSVSEILKAVRPRSVCIGELRWLHERIDGRLIRDCLSADFPSCQFSVFTPNSSTPSIITLEFRKLGRQAYALAKGVISRVTSLFMRIALPNGGRTTNLTMFLVTPNTKIGLWERLVMDYPAGAVFLPNGILDLLRLRLKTPIRYKLLLYPNLGILANEQAAFKKGDKDNISQELRTKLLALKKLDIPYPDSLYLLTLRKLSIVDGVIGQIEPHFRHLFVRYGISRLLVDSVQSIEYRVAVYCAQRMGISVEWVLHGHRTDRCSLDLPKRGFIDRFHSYGTVTTKFAADSGISEAQILRSKTPFIQGPPARNPQVRQLTFCVPLNTPLNYQYKLKTPVLFTLRFLEMIGKVQGIDRILVREHPEISRFSKLRDRIETLEEFGAKIFYDFGTWEESLSGSEIIVTSLHSTTFVQALNAGVITFPINLSFKPIHNCNSENKLISRRADELLLKLRNYCAGNYLIDSDLKKLKEEIFYDSKGR